MLSIACLCAVYSLDSTEDLPSLGVLLVLVHASSALKAEALKGLLMRVLWEYAGFTARLCPGGPVYWADRLV